MYEKIATSAVAWSLKYSRHLHKTETLSVKHIVSTHVSVQKKLPRFKPFFFFLKDWNDIQKETLGKPCIDCYYETVWCTTDTELLRALIEYQLYHILP